MMRESGNKRWEQGPAGYTPPTDDIMAQGLLPQSEITAPGNTPEPLPGAVEAGLQRIAAETHEQDVKAVERAGNWAVVSTLQEQVLDEYEQRVVEPRRFAWNEAAATMADFPFTTADARDSIQSWLEWDFVHPELHDIGHGLQVPLHIHLSAHAYHPKLPTAVKSLFITQWKMVNEREPWLLPRGDMRQALQELGIAAPRFHSLPGREAWNGPFTEAYVAHAHTLTATATIPAVADREPMVVSTVTMRRQDTERPAAITFRSGAQPASGQPTLKQNILELNEETVDQFLHTASAGLLRKLTGRTREPDLPTITEFMRKQLPPATNEPQTLHDLITLARQSTIAQS